MELWIQVYQNAIEPLILPKQNEERMQFSRIENQGNINEFYIEI